MRLIDADELVAQMEADAEQMDEMIAKMFAYAAINDVNHAPTVDAVPQWIPCSERLPEEGKEVLISSDSGLYIAELEILEGNVYWNETIEYRSVNRVSAWMPLPKPYEAERKEE